MDQKASDKSRLRQVQTTDLTESRLNDDFVYWLKKNGSNYLLVVLLVACGVLAWNYYNRQQVAKSAGAWTELSTASESRMPEPLEQVAKDHAEIPQVAMMALIAAGDLRLGQIQRGELSPAVGTTPAVPLGGGNRDHIAPVLFSSLFGRAAVAESRGDFDASKKYLEEVSTIAGGKWPSIADVAKTRLTGLVALAKPIAVPAAADIPVKTTVAPPATSTGSDDLFNSIIKEQQTGEQGGTTPAPVVPPAPTPGG